MDRDLFKQHSVNTVNLKSYRCRRDAAQFALSDQTGNQSERGLLISLTLCFPFFLFSVSFCFFIFFYFFYFICRTDRPTFNVSYILSNRKQRTIVTKIIILVWPDQTKLYLENIYKIVRGINIRTTLPRLPNFGTTTFRP